MDISSGSIEFKLKEIQLLYSLLAKCQYIENPNEAVHIVKNALIGLENTNHPVTANNLNNNSEISTSNPNYETVHEGKLWKHDENHNLIIKPSPKKPEKKQKKLVGLRQKSYIKDHQTTSLYRCKPVFTRSHTKPGPTGKPIIRRNPVRGSKLVCGQNSVYGRSPVQGRKLVCGLKPCCGDIKVRGGKQDRGKKRLQRVKPIYDRKPVYRQKPVRKPSRMNYPKCFLNLVCKEPYIVLERIDQNIFWKPSLNCVNNGINVQIVDFENIKRNNFGLPILNHRNKKVGEDIIGPNSLLSKISPKTGKQKINDKSVIKPLLIHKIDPMIDIDSLKTAHSSINNMVTNTKKTINLSAKQTKSLSKSLSNISTNDCRNMMNKAINSRSGHNIPVTNTACPYHCKPVFARSNTKTDPIGIPVSRRNPVCRQNLGHRQNLFNKLEPSCGKKRVQEWMLVRGKKPVCRKKPTHSVTKAKIGSRSKIENEANRPNERFVTTYLSKVKSRTRKCVSCDNIKEKSDILKNSSNKRKFICLNPKKSTIENLSNKEIDYNDIPNENLSASYNFSKDKLKYLNTNENYFIVRDRKKRGVVVGDTKTVYKRLQNDIKSRFQHIKEACKQPFIDEIPTVVMKRLRIDTENSENHEKDIEKITRNTDISKTFLNVPKSIEECMIEKHMNTLKDRKEIRIVLKRLEEDFVKNDVNLPSIPRNINSYDSSKIVKSSDLFKINSVSSGSVESKMEKIESLYSFLGKAQYIDNTNEAIRIVQNALIGLENSESLSLDDSYLNDGSEISTLNPTNNANLESKERQNDVNQNLCLNTTHDEHCNKEKNVFNSEAAPYMQDLQTMYPKPKYTSLLQYNDHIRTVLDEYNIGLISPEVPEHPAIPQNHVKQKNADCRRNTDCRQNPFKSVPKSNVQVQEVACSHHSNSVFTRSNTKAGPSGKPIIRMNPVQEQNFIFQHKSVYKTNVVLIKTIVNRLKPSFGWKQAQDGNAVGRQKPVCGVRLVGSPKPVSGWKSNIGEKTIDRCKPNLNQKPVFGTKVVPRLKPIRRQKPVDKRKSNHGEKEKCCSKLFKKQKPVYGRKTDCRQMPFRKRRQHRLEKPVDEQKQVVHLKNIVHRLKSSFGWLQAQEGKPVREQKQIRGMKPVCTQKQVVHMKTIVHRLKASFGWMQAQEAKPVREQKQVRGVKPVCEQKQVVHMKTIVHRLKPSFGWIQAQEAKPVREQKQVRGVKPVCEQKQVVYMKTIVHRLKPSFGWIQAQEAKPVRGQKQVQRVRPVFCQKKVYRKKTVDGQNLVHGKMSVQRKEPVCGGKQVSKKKTVCEGKQVRVWKPNGRRKPISGYKKLHVQKPDSGQKPVMGRKQVCRQKKDCRHKPISGGKQVCIWKSDGRRKQIGGRKIVNGQTQACGQMPISGLKPLQALDLVHGKKRVTERKSGCRQKPVHGWKPDSSNDSNIESNTIMNDKNILHSGEKDFTYSISNFVNKKCFVVLERIDKESSWNAAFDSVKYPKNRTAEILKKNDKNYCDLASLKQDKKHVVLSNIENNLEIRFHHISVVLCKQNSIDKIPKVAMKRLRFDIENFDNDANPILRKEDSDSDSVKQIKSSDSNHSSFKKPCRWLY